MQSKNKAKQSRSSLKLFRRKISHFFANFRVFVFFLRNPGSFSLPIAKLIIAKSLQITKEIFAKLSIFSKVSFSPTDRIAKTPFRKYYLINWLGGGQRKTRICRTRLCTGHSVETRGCNNFPCKGNLIEDLLDQGYNARNVDCSCVYSSLRAEFVNKNRCIRTVG